MKREMGLMLGLAAAGVAEGCNKPQNPREAQLQAAAEQQYIKEVHQEVCGNTTGPDCEMAIGTKMLSDGMSGKDTQRIKRIEFEMVHPDSPKQNPSESH